MAVTRNEDEVKRIQAVADSGKDGPILMLNLNLYVKEAEFPDGDLYRQYMTALDRLLPQVGGKILWRAPVLGQATGEQELDEILAVWYPSHRAFTELRSAPGADENFRLREECVEYAVIHRCHGDLAPLSSE
jgi:uncharacterized protein (DUF1330 family)